MLLQAAERIPQNFPLDHVQVVFVQTSTSQRRSRSCPLFFTNSTKCMMFSVAGMGKIWIVPTIRATSLIPKLEYSKGAALAQSLTQSKSHRFYTRRSGILSNSMTSPSGLKMALSRLFSVLVTRKSHAEKIVCHPH
jgi:hypothetical protein